jgi:UrcA family protein
MFSRTQDSNSKHPRRVALFTVAALLLAAAAGAQAASPGEETASLKVAYGDLDLATSAGNDALYARIVAAARTVCWASDVDSRDLHAVASERSCETRAISSAVQDVHSVKLAALSGERMRHG